MYIYACKYVCMSTEHVSDHVHASNDNGVINGASFKRESLLQFDFHISPLILTRTKTNHIKKKITSPGLSSYSLRREVAFIFLVLRTDYV